MRRGFVLGTTVVVLGFAAVLLAVAFCLVSNNTRDVSRYLRQTERRLLAQAAADEFVELVQRRFDQAVWEKPDGSDTVEFMADVGSIHAKFFTGEGGGMSHSLASTIREFNAFHEGSGDGVGVLTNLPVTVEVRTDADGVAKYADVTFRVGANGQAVEETVRFGALGFGPAPGHYDNDVRALPTRAVESAINADCPLVFGNCRGTSGWTINGELRTRGYVRFVRPGPGAAATRVHGEIHVRKMPQTGAAPFPDETPNGSVIGVTPRSCHPATESGGDGLLALCANGPNVPLRFPSPGRRRDLPVPEPGSAEWYGYSPSMDDASGAAGSNGVWRGGYEWRRVEGANGLLATNDPSGSVHVGERADWFGIECADWFHIPTMSHLKDFLKQFGGSLQTKNLNKKDLALTLGLYPDGSPVAFNLPGATRVTVNTSTRETLYLLGTWQKPVVLDGPVYWHGDVVIGGFVTGQGAVYAGRNIHIVRDVVMRYPPTWRQDVDYDRAARETNARADMLALLARGSIVIGNWADETSRNAADGVTGFREKVRLASSLSERATALTSRLDGYTYRAPVPLAPDSQFGAGAFGGDYFSTHEGVPLLHPRNESDYLGNAVTNLCRPVVRIDAMLVSENAIVGVVGPGDFSWAKAKLEPELSGDDGLATYPGRSSSSLRAGHGMKLEGSTLRQRPEDYLLPERTAFELNGGLVCRDLAIYVDWDGHEEWEGRSDEVQALVNWDMRYQADGDDALTMTREFMRTAQRPYDKHRLDNDHPQNVLGLPSDSSPKPQILTWRYLTDGVGEIAW